MSINPDTANTQFRDAIRDAYREASWTGDEETAVSLLVTAAKDAFAAMLPDIIKTAMEDPKTTTAMAQQVIVPMLREIEDLINADHDARTTHPTHRPGLARAARIIRLARTDIQTETSK